MTEHRDRYSSVLVHTPWMVVTAGLQAISWRFSHSSDSHVQILPTRRGGRVVLSSIPEVVWQSIS